MNEIKAISLSDDSVVISGKLFDELSSLPAKTERLVKENEQLRDALKELRSWANPGECTAYTKIIDKVLYLDKEKAG